VRCRHGDVHAVVGVLHHFDIHPIRDIQAVFRQDGLRVSYQTKLQGLTYPLLE
jgi:hypothetical protein